MEQSLNYSIRPWTEPRVRYFAIQAVDNVGNRSRLVTTEVTIPPVEAAFYDDFDGESKGWEAESTWGKVREPGRGLVWTDTPEGNTPPGAELSLTSPEISLEGRQNARLVFDARHQMERYRDQLHVEVSSDGENWRMLDVLHDSEPEWVTQQYDLSRYDGQTIQLRFRMKMNNNDVALDGIYLDRLVVAAENVADSGTLFEG